MSARFAVALLSAVILAGCQDQQSTVVPQAVAMTEEALGHYCQMNLTEHEGPKAQIHLANFEHPIWFSQVRDAVAFTRLPEETDEVTAIYVSDMGKAARWADPGKDNWVDAADAWFVIGSGQRGGMGAPEAVPFGNEAVARAFSNDNGGSVVRLADIPDDYVLAPVEVAPMSMDHNATSSHASGEHGAHATQ